VRGALAVAVLLGGCAVQTDYLDGSLVDLFDLGFTHTRVRLYDSELSVEYVDSARQEEVALRVTVDNEGDLAEGDTYDLVARGQVGWSDSFGSSLPDLESGELRLSRYDEVDGEPVRGSFEAVFTSPDETRMSVLGGFSAELEVVGAL